LFYRRRGTGEPCQGLEAEHIERLKNLVTRYYEYFGATPIFVIHYTRELAACISQFMRLEKDILV
jgi:ABC-type molybdenum transport system ATPase subunit/photorepair protein PhrA